MFLSFDFDIVICFFAHETNIAQMDAVHGLLKDETITKSFQKKLSRNE
jgi:hypothetical protein